MRSSVKNEGGWKLLSRFGPRGILPRLIIVGVAFALLSSSCGGADQDEAAPGDQETVAAQVESIAILLPGKQDDPGWSGLGWSGVEAMVEKYGVETAVAESVDVAQQVEVYRDFASQEFDLIVGWGGQYEDGAMEIAEEFPETHFAVASGLSGNGSNYSSVDFANEQFTFLLGYIAGKVTETNVVGAINGICFDASARNIHGFRDGAVHANPEVEVLATGLDSFDDPAGAKEAALAQIAEGADAIYMNLNTGNLGVFEAAKEKDILAITDYVDQHEQAPDVILTSALRDASAFTGAVVERVLDGSFDGEPIRIQLTEDWDALAEFRGLAPESLYQEAKEIQAQIASGDLEVTGDGSCPVKGTR